MIHLGNGMSSQGEVYMVHKKLAEAFEMRSGMQQGVDINSPEYKQGQHDIEMVVREIAAALGVKASIVPSNGKL